MTTYNNLIPQNQTPKSAQQPIKDNFTTFANAFAINHQAMNSLNQGNHTFLVLKTQTTPAIINKDIGTLFCKSLTNARGTSNQVFYNYSSYTTTKVNTVQMTYNDITYIGTQQQTFYLGGYVVYMGKLAYTSNSLTVNLTPNSSGLFFAGATLETPAPLATPIPSANIVSSSQVIFSTSASIAGATLNYVIIGQQ